jgi:hypothetical protein
MRRRYVLALVLATALIFALGGLGVGYAVWHGGGSAGTDTPTPSESPSPTASPTPVKLTKVEALAKVDAWFRLNFEGYRTPTAGQGIDSESLKCPDVGLNGAGDAWLALCSYSLTTWVGGTQLEPINIDLRLQVDAVTGTISRLP